MNIPSNLIKPELRAFQIAAVFVTLVLGATLLDVFGPWLVQRHVGLATVGWAKWTALVLAGATFVIALWKVLPPEGPVSAISLGKAFSTKQGAGDSLLIVRFFAFLCVWMTHAALLLKPGSYVWDSEHFLLRGCAHQGMSVFFTLSGYLMGKAFYRGRYVVNRQGLLSFYHNRAMRIVPLYLFAQLLVFLLVRPELLSSVNWESLVRLATFNYYSSPGQAGPIGALWSLSTEMQYYLLVPFFYIIFSGWLRSSIRTLVGMLLTASIWLALRLWLHSLGSDWQVHRYTPLFVNLDLFLIGFWSNGLVERLISSCSGGRRGAVWFFAGTVLMIGLYVGACAFSGVPWLETSQGGLVAAGPGSRAYEFAPTFSSLCTAGIIICFEVGAWAYGQGRQLEGNRSSIIWRGLQYAGTITYGLYVWHAPVGEALNKVIPPDALLPVYLVRNVTCLLGATALSIATYYLVELPFVSKKIFNS